MRKKLIIVLAIIFVCLISAFIVTYIRVNDKDYNVYTESGTEPASVLTDTLTENETSISNTETSVDDYIDTYLLSNYKTYSLTKEWHDDYTNLDYRLYSVQTNTYTCDLYVTISETGVTFNEDYQPDYIGPQVEY